MKQNEVFNVESVRAYIIEKINALDNFDTLFTIYRFVRRILEESGKN